MKLEDIITKIEHISKKEIKRVAPKDFNAIKRIIMDSTPASPYEKMVLGYLTSICAEYMFPEVLTIEKENLDYVGFELDKGNIEVKIAGDMLGTCMRQGRIVAKSAGYETGKSMTGGEIIASEIKSIGNTIGGVIRAEKVGKISKTQGAKIYIGNAKYKRGLLDRLLGR